MLQCSELILIFKNLVGENLATPDLTDSALNGPKLPDHTLTILCGFYIWNAQYKHK